MEEVETDKILSKNKALKYLELLKNNNVESWIYKVGLRKPNFFRKYSEYLTIPSPLTEYSDLVITYISDIIPTTQNQ